MGEDQIDLMRLPGDVAALVEALQPGEELVITRDGLPIATIAGAAGALEGTIILPERAEAAEQTERAEETQRLPLAGRSDVTVVATAMKLPESARTLLSDQLGTDYIVVDMHAAPATADVLLVPPVSPQLIGHLRRMFPRARVVVTEIEDAQLGVSYRGPIGRLLDAGAETYLAPGTIPSLAGRLEQEITQRLSVTGGVRERPEIES